MKKIALLVIAAVVSLTSLTACGQTAESKQPTNMGTKTLIAYFSATGTTEKVAKDIAEATGGDLCEIQPEQPYSADDLDWTNPSSRSCREHADPNARPAIRKPTLDVASYDVIYLGYPIWWDEAPKVVNTFIESLSLKGKKVIPFATSGGSGIANSVRALQKAYPDMDWQRGRLLNGASMDEIKAWVSK